MRAIQPSAAPVLIARPVRFLLLVTMLVSSVLTAGALPLFFDTGSTLALPTDVTPMSGNEIDPAIAICPATASGFTASNMFVASLSDIQSGIVAAYSVNQGLTWTKNVIATNNSATLPPALGEPTVAWDTYGNLFLAYIPQYGEGVAVCVSTNGGKSFSLVTNLASGDSTDQPRLATATIGAGMGVLYLAYKDYSAFRAPVVVQGLASAGLGVIGRFSPAKTVAGSTNNCGFPDLSVGPSNQVMVVFQDTANQPGFASIYVSVNTNVLGSGIFGAAAQVAEDAVGGLSYLPADEVGLGVNAAPGVVWDNNPNSAYYGRAYLVYTAYGVNGNFVINSMYSTNGGVTWSGEAQVDDDFSGGNDHFFPRVAVDPSTGVVAYTWMDCRADLGSASEVINYTNRVSITLRNFYATNVTVANLTSPANNTINTQVTDLSNGAGTNYYVIETGTNVWGTQATSSGGGNVYIVSLINPAGGPNVQITFNGTNTAPAATNTTVLIDITNSFPDAYTGGSAANTDAQPYMTVSMDGDNSFQPNIPVIPTNTVLSPPSISLVSDVYRSTGQFSYGHYTGLAFYDGNFYPVWPDNSDMSALDPDGNTNFDICLADVVVPTADIQALVTWAPNPVISGGSVVLSLVLTNAGPYPAANFYAEDLLPSNLTFERAVPASGGTLEISGQLLYFTWPRLGTLAAHSSLTSTIFCQAADGAFATNVAVGGSSLPDTVPTNNVVTNIIPMLGEDLAVGITASTSVANLGQPVTFTVLVTNFGPAVDGTVYVTNTLPSNLSNVTNVNQPQGTYTLNGNILLFNLGTLASNQVVTLTYDASPVSKGVNSQTAKVTAVVSSLDIDTNLLNNTSFTTVSILGEDLGIGFSASAPSVNVGNSVIFTLNITNFGPATNGDVTFTDVIPPNLGQISILQFPPEGSGAFNGNTFSFDLGDMAAGQVVTVRYSATALSLGSPVTNVVTTVTAQSTDFDTNTVNNTVSLTTTINGADLAVGGFANPPFAATNTTLTYTVNLTNFGPSTINAVTVTNLLSTNLGPITILQAPGSFYPYGSNWIFNVGTLKPGQTATIVFSATTLSLGTATATLTAGSSVFDTNPVNNTAVLAVPVSSQPGFMTNFTVTSFPTGAIVSWTTPYAASVQFAYGLTTNLGFLTAQTGPSTNHSYFLTGLKPDTNYYFTAMNWEAGSYYSTNGIFQASASIILTTGDASYSNLWAQGAPGTPGIYGTYFNDTQTSQSNYTATATYTPNVVLPAFYNVFIWYPQGTNFSTNVPVIVTGATNAAAISVNQSTNGGQWVPLATNLYFNTGAAGHAVIYNQTGESNRVVAANAMKFTYAAFQDFSVNGVVPLWWANYYFPGNPAAANAYYLDYLLGLPPGADTTGATTLAFSHGSNHTTSFIFSPYETGRAYQLQSITNLDKTNWVTLTNQAALNPVGDGSGIITVTNPAAGQMFYRFSISLSTNY